MVRASVAMTVYNDEKYIRGQIDSILDMMRENDELVISYDKSTNAIRNFVKGTYLDGQMAVTSIIKEKIWPIDVKHRMLHDLILGVKGARYGRVELMDEKLLYVMPPVMIGYSFQLIYTMYVNIEQIKRRLKVWLSQALL